MPYSNASGIRSFPVAVSPNDWGHSGSALRSRESPSCAPNAPSAGPSYKPEGKPAPEGRARATGEEEVWVESELVYVLPVLKFRYVSPCDFNIRLIFSESIRIYVYIHIFNCRYIYI